MIKLILILPMVMLIFGVLFIGLQLYKVVFAKTISIVDDSYECLTASAEQIRSISQKYGSRIRGSIRLRQGRLKSTSEIRLKEKEIIFP